MNKISILKKGHEEFRKIKFKENEDRFKRLVDEGQSPKALFIGCSDSRLMPSMITGSEAGDLFVVRNIGNFVPPFKPVNDYHATASAIEYAVSVLGISDIIVCGHSDCGAIKAVWQPPKPTAETIHTIKWLELGQKAKEKAESALPHAEQKELLNYTEKISVVLQLENLLTYPAVKRGVENGSIFLHGWHYDLGNGKIEYYDEDKMLFETFTE
ncbi:MAG: carbonic anhydrase [Sulfurovum sp.]|nr:carbonic anhydrase [Sulfurovum sp.]